MLNLVAIGKYIAKLRIENNLSQPQLANKLYVTHQAISKWENGLSIPSLDTMINLTKLFNITIDELLRCEERLSNNYSDLLKSYPREFCLNLLIKGKLDVCIEEVLYLLNIEEREVVISNVINNHLQINIPELLPYLNIVERRRIINAIINKQLNCDFSQIAHMLTKNEKIQLTGGIYEY